jgi:hypothetical protein
MPLIPIDFSKLPESWIKQILSAVFPGGLLVIGLAVTHQSLTVQFLKYGELNGLAKSVLGIFVSFALGYLMLTFGASVLLLFYSLGYSVISVSRRRMNIVPEESKNLVWRRIVAYSLPRQLIAVEEPAVSAEAFNHKLQEIKSKIGTTDRSALVEAVETAGRVQLNRVQADQEWAYMFSVLQCYFFRQPNDDVWNGLATQFAVSIALGVVAWFGTFIPAVLWTLSILCGVVAAGVTFFFGVHAGFSNPLEAISGANVAREWLSPKSQPTSPPAPPPPARPE